MYFIMCVISFPHTDTHTLWKLFSLQAKLWRKCFPCLDLKIGHGCWGQLKSASKDTSSWQARSWPFDLLNPFCPGWKLGRGGLARFSVHAMLQGHALGCLWIPTARLSSPAKHPPLHFVPILETEKEIGIIGVDGNLVCCGRADEPPYQHTVSHTCSTKSWGPPALPVFHGLDTHTAARLLITTSLWRPATAAAGNSCLGAVFEIFSFSSFRNFSPCLFPLEKNMNGSPFSYLLCKHHQNLQ